MTIHFNETQKSKFTKIITEVLARVQLDDGLSIDPMSYSMDFYELDNIIPQNGNLRKSLISYISEFPIFDFIHNYLNAEIRNLTRYGRDPNLNLLTDVRRFSDLDLLATELISKLESLPWKYCMTMPIPFQLSKLFKSAIDNFIFSEDFQLIRATSSTAQSFPLPTAEQIGDSAFGGVLGKHVFKDQQWSINDIYIQFIATGFIDSYGSSTPNLKIVSNLKAFYGLLIAYDMIEIKKYNAKKSYEVFKFWAHKQSSIWTYEDDIFIDTYISNAIRNIQIRGEFVNLPADSQHKKVIHVFEQIKCAFSNNESAERVWLAAQWLFDSYANSDDLLNYIQAMVVLEILLGDADPNKQISLSELMSNRCAYLISNTQVERTELKNKFKKIYGVRSKIVHQGKLNLDRKDQLLFGELQSICRRVIKAEIKLLQ